MIVSTIVDPDSGGATVTYRALTAQDLRQLDRRVDDWVAAQGPGFAEAVSAIAHGTAVGAAMSQAALAPGRDADTRAVLAAVAAGTPASHRLLVAAARARSPIALEALPPASFEAGSFEVAAPRPRAGRRMLTASTPLTGVTLTLPADFHQLPLDQQLEHRVAAQTRLLDRLPSAAGGRRELVALSLEAMARQLRTVDIAAAALCAVRTGGHASTATLTVGFHETATAVGTTTYAGHPAVTWTGERQVAGGTVVREAQVLVHAPDLPVAVLISLATPVPRDWEAYRRVMHDVCMSLRFDPAARPRDEAVGRVVPLPRGRARRPVSPSPGAPGRCGRSG